jgi:hypothetical protein
VGASDFETYREALQRYGFREIESRYEQRTFGSWLITLEGEPRSRLVWYGKEHWLLVQQQRGESWLDTWVARDASEQTPVAAIAELERLQGHS